MADQRGLLSELECLQCGLIEVDDVVLLDQQNGDRRVVDELPVAVFAATQCLFGRFSVLAQFGLFDFALDGRSQAGEVVEINEIVGAGFQQ